MGKSFYHISHLPQHKQFILDRDVSQCNEWEKSPVTNPTLYNIWQFLLEKNFRIVMNVEVFSLNPSLANHQKVHTGEKSWNFNDSGKVFSHTSSLVKNERIHTGGKTYKCKECNKVFSCNLYLAEHWIIDTGQKTFKYEYGRCSVALATLCVIIGVILWRKLINVMNVAEFSVQTHL